MTAPATSAANAPRQRRSTYAHSPVLGPCADGNFIEFYKRTEGEPPNEREQDWYRIVIPGNVRDEAHFPLSEERQQRYTAQWKQWQAAQQGDTAIYDGEPLRDWDGIAISMAENFERQGVRSVEMLASVSDSDIGRLGHGAREVRERAKNHVKAKRDNKPINDLRRDVDELKQGLAALTESIGELAQTLGAGKKGKAA